jgi:hypothetical protein
LHAPTGIGPEHRVSTKSSARLSRNNTERTLVLHTGTSPSNDYVSVARAAIELVAQGRPLERDQLVACMYGQPLDPIDYSVFVGPPRDWVMPPLLWSDGPRFQTRTSNLSLSREQIIKALYFTALARHRKLNAYYDYGSMGAEQRSALREKFERYSHELFGTEFYGDETEIDEAVSGKRDHEST